MENLDQVPERQLSGEAEWKLIQRNTFTRWINEHLKTVNKQIANIDTDLSDGLRLISLVEVLSGKSFLKYNKRPTVRTQMLENNTMALKFLQNIEKIKIVNIDSSDIVDHNTKLILGLIWMLILHYSISTGNWDDDAANVQSSSRISEMSPKQRLLNWIQGKISDLSISNFSTNWNNGRAIGALVDGVAPGLCPDWYEWQAENAIQNAREAMQAAEQWLDVAQLIKPEEMCSEHVDEQSVMTYLSQFPNAKLKEGAPLRPKTNPSRVRVYGPGLEPSGVKKGRQTEFTIETFGSGAGQLDIKILDRYGKYLTNMLTYNNDKYKTYTCEYTALEDGMHKIHIKFADKEIQKSPFVINVANVVFDLSKISIVGRGVQDGVIQGQQTEFCIKSKDELSGNVVVAITDHTGQPLLSKVSKVSNDEMKVTYTPTLPGSLKIDALIENQRPPHFPVMINVLPAVDLSKWTITGRGIQNKGARVGDRLTFFIKSDDPIKSTDLSVHVKDNYKEIPLTVNQIDSCSIQYEYIAEYPANLLVTALYRDKVIGRCPCEVVVQPKKECKVLAYGPGLVSGLTDHLATFTVNTNDETGTLGFSIEGPSQARINCHDNEDGTADVSYITGVPGEYVVHVLCDDEDINNSPFISQIRPSNINVDVTKIQVGGPAFADQPLVIDKPTFFTVTNNMSHPIDVYIYDEESNNLSFSRDAKSEKFTFKPTKTGKYCVYILASGVPLKGSPFKMVVEEASMPELVKVLGPALLGKNKTFEQTSFLVDCLHAGQGDVGISLTDNNGNNIAITTQQLDNKQFNVEFNTGNATSLEAHIYFGNVEIPTSPLYITVHPSIDLSQVKVMGIKNEMYLESPHEIKCDMSTVGGCKVDDLSLVYTNLFDESVEAFFVKTIDGMYSTNIIFTSTGMHKIELLYKGMHVSGSPFSIKAVHGNDPKAVQVYGPGLSKGKTLEAQIFTVDTRGAGQGGLDLSIEGPCEAKMTCRDNRDGTCSVDYLPVVQGLYDIAIKFSNVHVPGSPFAVMIKDKLDATKVNCLLAPGEVRRGEIYFFDLDTTSAGEGQLNVLVTDSKGKQVKTDIAEKDVGKFEAKLVAQNEGPHKISVTYANLSIPGSPFTVDIMPEAKSETKEQIKPISNGNLNGMAPLIFNGEDEIDDFRNSNNKFFPVEYIVPVGPILTFLQAKVSSPSCNDVGHVDIVDNGDGTATIRYIPTEKGLHSMYVKYNNIPVDSSPFQFQAISMEGVGVKAYGAGLSGGVCGTPAEFVVDFGTASSGGFVIAIDGPAKAAIDINNLDRNATSTKCRVVYTPEVAGEYFLLLKYAGQHIEGSPFKAKILPLTDGSSEAEFSFGQQTSGDASTRGQNIQVYGPGITDLIMPNSWNDFHVNYKNAGKGSLKISIDGPSKVELICSSDKESISCMKYKADMPGTYVINVFFEGKHVNGSPFLVNVRNISEEQTSSNMLDPTANIHAYTSMSHVGKKCNINLQVPGLSLKNLTAQVNCHSSGTQEKCKIEEISPSIYSISFVPKETGVYFLHVASTDLVIPGNPFHFFIGPYVGKDDRKDDLVQVTGQGLTGGRVNCSGRINVKAQDYGSGDLCVSMEGVEKPTLTFEDLQDGTCEVSYLCSQPGNYLLTVKLNGVHAIGSPFCIPIQPDDNVMPNNVLPIENFQPYKPAHLKLKGYSDDKMNVNILSPNGKLVSSIIQNTTSDNYIVRFIPRENGVYSVSISQNGTAVPGSPFQLMVGQVEIDPKKVIATGDGLSKGKTGEMHMFEVDASATGPAPVLVTVDGPSKAFIECIEADEVKKKFRFSYSAVAAGIYQVSVVYGGQNQHISGSPFKVQLTGQGRPLPWNERSSLEVGNMALNNNNNNNLATCQDAEISKLNCQGVGLLKASVNQLGTFHVDSLLFAKEMLMVGVLGPSGPCTEVKLLKESRTRFVVNYRPFETGLHQIAVTLGETAAPGSPFKILVK